MDLLTKDIEEKSENTQDRGSHDRKQIESGTFN